MAGGDLPGLDIPKELYSGENGVPYFVPILDQKPSQTVTLEQESKSPLLARRISTIANRRTQWENRTPQLLTEGLLGSAQRQGY
jgi:hypothetical protein